MRTSNDPRNSTRRRGVTAVEASLLLGIFLMFVFGIFEYSRYLMVLHVTTNAARDGARYASVNVSEPTNFDTTPIEGKTNIRRYVLDRMGGVEGMIAPPGSGGAFENLVEVFPCDTAQLYADPPNITPKPGWGPNPGSRTVHWNQAAFTERIAVRITGVYRPILPNFLGMDNEIPIRVAVVMGSEG